MSDLAERLRAAREKLGVSIEEAERITKIRRRYIEAIEAGDFERLPDGPPARGFVKNYARYLGLDADQSITDLEAEVGIPIAQVNEVVPPPPTHQQPQSRYTQLVKVPQLRYRGDIPSTEQSELDMMAEAPGESHSDNGHKDTAVGRQVFRRDEPAMTPNSFSLRVPKVTQASDVRPINTGRSALSLRGLVNGLGNEAISPPRHMSPMSMYASDNATVALTIGVILGGLALVAALILFVIAPALRGTGQAAAPPSATQAITVSIIGATSQPSMTYSMPLTQTGAVTVPVSANSITPTPHAPAANAPQPIPGGGVQLVLDALEHAWVRVKVDGKVVYEGIPQVGPNSSWHGQNTVGIETANAGAFDIILNNVRLGPVGGRNTVARVTWDTSGKVVGNQ